MNRKQEIPEVANAVIYARFSSHSQTEQSIEGQLRVCYEYAQRKGYTVVGEYIDRALTGRSDDRPDFQRMIADSSKKAFRYVIVYKMDRFARNRYDSAIYKHKLKLNGVKVLSAMENIGDNPESVILEAVLEASAEYYSIDLSQKIKRGSRESALKGQFLGGMVPFGYKVADHHLVIDEEKAPIVRYLFEQYAAGVPKRKIIAEINARGFRNRYGQPFRGDAFQATLHCEKYIGRMRWNDVVSECPALIDQETFDRVQRRLAQNKRAPGKGNAKIEYLLSGKVFCGCCGSTVSGVSGTSKTGQTHYYYYCRGRRLKNGCQKKNERKDDLERFIAEQTVKYILSPSRMHEIAAGVISQYNKEFNGDKIKELERLVKKLDRDITKYTESLPELPKSAWAIVGQKIEEATTRKADIEIDLAKLRIANEIRYTEEDVIAWLQTFRKGNLDDAAFRRQLIDVFVNTVYLYNDYIIIFYNISAEQPTFPPEINTNSPEKQQKKATPVDEDCPSKAMVELTGLEPMTSRV